MPEKYRPGNPPDVRPDTGKQSVIERDLPVTKAVAMILAMMPALALDGDDFDVPKPKPVITDVAQPTVEKAALSSQEITDAESRLRATLNAVRSPEVREKVLMLNPRASLKEACRAVSNWMIDNSQDLDLVWRTFYARRDAWSPELKTEFERMVNDMKRVPGSAQSLGEMHERIRTRLINKNPLKCGAAVWFASFIIKTPEVQDRGMKIMENIAEFFIQDMQNADVSIKRDAYESVQAMTRAGESIKK